MSDELRLYKFCEDKEIRWEILYTQEHLILWIPFDELGEFVDIVGYNMLDDGGIECHLQENCIAIDLVPICEELGIEPEEILEME